MNQGMLTGPEAVTYYATAAGKKKAETAPGKLLLLGISAGFMIGLGAVAAGTASFAIQNPGLARIVSGMIFPIGLGMVMLMGSELFTGNTMIILSVLERQTSLAKMMRNWICVYFGNMIGAVLVAAAIVYSGQLNLGGGSLAVYAIKTAAAKCAPCNSVLG